MKAITFEKIGNNVKKFEEIEFMDIVLQPFYLAIKYDTVEEETFLFIQDILRF